MSDFTEEEIQNVWEKGFEVEGYDSALFRQDVADAWMRRDKYGIEDSFGWEIDHVYPLSKGGDSDIDNLRPMQWENNRKKADDYPNYFTAVTSDGGKNIYKVNYFLVNKELQVALKEMYKVK